MEILECLQGSESWHAARAQHYCASDMSAILSLSKYKTRNQLLQEKATGITPDQSDKQWLFNKGHEAESLARPIAEKIIDEELYPCVGSTIIDGLPFLASFDGITMSEVDIFEHKLWSQTIVENVADGDLPNENWPQVEAQLLVSGADRALFMCSDGTEENCVWFWYESMPTRREKLIAAVKQFDADLKAYVPTDAVVTPTAAPILALPAVSVQINGALAVISNLDMFGARLKTFCEGIKTKPETDQDFVDLKASIKVLEKAEDALLSAQAGALEQVVEVADMQRLVGLYHDLARTTRIATEKLVKAETENRKAAIQQTGKDAIAEHFAALNARLGKHYMPGVVADIPGVCRGLSSLDSMKNKVDAEVARWKIEANAVADRIQANMKTLAELCADYPMLLKHEAQLVLKNPDDMVSQVKVWIAEHKVIEEKKLEVERERIRAEEQIKAEFEAAQKVVVAQKQIPSEQAKLRDIGKFIAEQHASPTATPPTLSIGKISTRLGFNVTAEFLRTLGFEGAKDRAAMLYHDSQFLLICRAIIAHLQRLEA